MSNEKMREEFEVWYSEQFKHSDKKLTRHSETYLSPFVGGMWMAWQASRAALCVELPRIGAPHHSATYIAPEFRQAIDVAGVRYK